MIDKNGEHNSCSQPRPRHNWDKALMMSFSSFYITNFFFLISFPFFPKLFIISLFHRPTGFLSFKHKQCQKGLIWFEIS